MNALKIITRNSPLALKQVDEVQKLRPDLHFDVVATESFGDRHKDISLLNVAADFFTRELDEALLLGTADLAVHSAKDLPYPLHPDLEVECLTAAKDNSDSLVSRNALTLSQLEKGSRVGTSSKTRQSELAKLRPDLQIVDVRGTIQERLNLISTNQIDALVVATCALQRLDLQHLIAERLPFRTHPLQGHLAVVAKKAKHSEFSQLFAHHDVRRNYGRVTLVGFGPGDAELLTIKGLHALESADVIVHDDLIDSEFLARFRAQKIYVGKRAGRHSHEQNEINELLYEHALKGHEVVRLKGGDPMIFAHGREEIDFLRSRLVEVRSIAGVSAANAFASSSLIPLTHRNTARSVAFVNGHADVAQTPDTETIVYYMGGKNLSAIADKLIASGRDAQTSVAVALAISTPNERVIFTTLGQARFATIKTSLPVLIVVGQVIDLQAHTQPTLNTASEQNDDAQTVHTPLLSFTSTDEVDVALDYDWIAFSSPRAVQFYLAMLARKGVLPKHLAEWSARGGRIASVGAATSLAIKSAGLAVDVEAETESAEGLIALLSNKLHTSQRFLLPSSDRALPTLRQGLEARGHVVKQLPIYRTRTNIFAKRIDPSGFAKIAFASPSGVDAFVEIYGHLPEDTLLIAKGLTTLERLKNINISD